ncbi:hypothetical protein CCM_07364 [Cordyceps militaris CM01]|uniref:Uncharacterized protein n=1 Tax=Cordyceps militaris (strain CM01) TaxID=983644 RepID=G3JQT6_CORMM|nr:uncharacterized protein CCM_07364 [Cordyceps militaris CM01]EGX89112.1 hypothetical protein CCM_07364 [Cordyceps militaris CM01]
MTDIILGREARWHGQQRPSVIGWVPKLVPNKILQDARQGQPASVAPKKKKRNHQKRKEKETWGATCQTTHPSIHPPSRTPPVPSALVHTPPRLAHHQQHNSTRNEFTSRVNPASLAALARFPSLLGLIYLAGSRLHPSPALCHVVESQTGRCVEPWDYTELLVTTTHHQTSATATLVPRPRPAGLTLLSSGGLVASRPEASIPNTQPAFQSPIFCDNLSPPHLIDDEILAQPPLASLPLSWHLTLVFQDAIFAVLKKGPSCFTSQALLFYRAALHQSETSRCWYKDWRTSATTSHYCVTLPTSTSVALLHKCDLDTLVLALSRLHKPASPIPPIPTRHYISTALLPLPPAAPPFVILIYTGLALADTTFIYFHRQ